MISTLQNLRRRYLATVFAAVSLSASVLAQTHTATVVSRNDVDLAFVGSTLVALFRQADGWQTARLTPESTLETACRFQGRAWFSFDKQAVLTWNGMGTPKLEARDPVSCEIRASIAPEGVARDADVSLQSNRIAVAHRSAEGIALSLYDFLGNRIGDLGKLRNAELGFSPDGAALLNLDHGGGKSAIWRSKDGVRLDLRDGTGLDHHFSGDGQWAFATALGKVVRTRWQLPFKQGRARESTASEVSIQASEVLRGVSHAGNTLILQASNAARPAHPSVRLLDTVTAQSKVLGAGHIDAVALDRAGHQTAIAIRAEHGNAVTIIHVQVNHQFTP